MTFEQKLFSALRPKRTRPRRKRRGTRRGPWRSEAYRRWIAARPCLICGEPEVQAAHTEHNGMASKGSDASCVPLCPFHHDQADGRRDMGGKYGKRCFERNYGVDLAEVAHQLHAEWVLSHFPEEREECRCEVSGDWKSGDCEYCRSLRVPHYREAGNAEECPF